MKPGASRAVNLLNQSGQLALWRGVWLRLPDERQRRLVTAVVGTWSEAWGVRAGAGAGPSSASYGPAMRCATSSSSSPRASSRPAPPSAEGGTRALVFASGGVPPTRPVSVRGGRSRHSPPLASAASRGKAPSFRVRARWVAVGQRPVEQALSGRAISGQLPLRSAPPRPDGRTTGAYGTACLRAIACRSRSALASHARWSDCQPASCPWLQDINENLTQYRRASLADWQALPGDAWIIAGSA
jgi:hypothetical protein